MRARILQTGASPFDSLVCRAARDRKHGGVVQARVARWGSPRSAPTGVNHRRSPNAYSAARLRCRDLLLRRARVAAGRCPRQERRAGPHRAQGRQARQPHPHAPWAAQAQGQPRPLARAAASDHTGDMLRADYLSHDSSDGTPMATRVRRYTGARLGRGEHRGRLAPPRQSRAAVVRMWMASPGHRAVLLSPNEPPHRRRPAQRGRLGSAAYSVFTADLASATLTASGGGLAFAVGR